MKKAIDSNGNQIGLFDGNTIKDSNGNVVYWFSDEDVFAPVEYSESHLQAFNKGQSILIGKYIESQCLAGDDVIFKIVQ